MDLFLPRQADKVAGVLSCWDRVVITGTISGICFAQGMTWFLNANGIRVFDYPKWAEPLASQPDPENCRDLGFKSSLSEVDRVVKTISRCFLDAVP